MDQTIFKRMKQRIDDYFDTLSDEKLREDLNKANYDFYRTVKTPVFRPVIPGRAFFSKIDHEFSLKIKSVSLYEGFNKTETSFEYQIAA